MYLALSHYLVQQYAESEQVLLEIKAGANAPLDYQILLGSVRARMEKWDTAQPILESTIEKEPNRADGYLNLGLFLLERGEHDRAIQLFVTAARLANRGTKLLYTIQSRKNCAGLQPPQRGPAENFSRAELLSDLAQELHRRQQSGSAVEVYMLALRSDPGSARANAGLGKVCWELDSVSEARRFVETGLSFHPNFAPLHFNLGLIQQSMGGAHDAILSYRKALELEGEKANPLYWIQLGTAQQAAGQIDEAERSYRKGLELQPQLAEGHYELGKLYFYLKDLVHAEEEFQNAIELDPALLRAYYQLGLVCSRNGKVDRGRELLNTFHRKKELYGADDRLVEAPAGL
jgi:tetratricopeptide (TPR) repeat protein